MPGVLIHLLLLILAFTFIFQARNLAEADYKLMRALCHNSETPETCMRCVKPAPGAEKADSVGIATIVVNCLNNQAQTLAANLTRLASETSDHKLKILYQSCAQMYSATKKQLASVNQYLQGHKYDNAESSAVRALESVQDCNQQLKSFENRVSYDVIFYTRIYEELTEAACRIIEKIY